MIWLMLGMAVVLVIPATIVTFPALEWAINWGVDKPSIVAMPVAMAAALGPIGTAFAIGCGVIVLVVD